MKGGSSGRLGKKSLVSRVKQLTKGVLTKSLAGLVLLHAGTQVVYLGNCAQHRLFPSQEREAFREEFGFALDGWEADIEEKPENISSIAMVVAKEMHERTFSPSSLEVRSKSYFTMNFVDQFNYLFTRDNIGYVLFDSITIEHGAAARYLHHEVKHVKTKEIMEEHPEFEKRWRETAKGDDGKSLYLSQMERALYTLGFDWFLSQDFRDRTVAEQKGFVSVYSRTHFLEDIAEIGEFVEEDRDGKMAEGWLFGPGHNAKIIAKIELAQEYGLIPKEYLEYAELMSVFRGTWSSPGELNSDVDDLFFAQSSAFLEQYPQGVYEIAVRRSRGDVLLAQARVCSDNACYSIMPAINELESGLRSEYKDPIEYVLILQRLHDAHLEQGNKEIAQVYLASMSLFASRWFDGDVLLTKRGVNDFLEDAEVLGNYFLEK